MVKAWLGRHRELSYNLRKSGNNKGVLMRLIQWLQPAAWVLMGSLLASQSVAQGAQEIDKSRAAEIAQSQVGGELFGKIKKSKLADGTNVYEVRLDKGGRMTIVTVDTHGKILKIQ